MPAQIFGSQATAVQLYVAFYGVAPSNPVYTNSLSLINSTSASNLASLMAAQFAGTSNTALATQVLTNLNITTTTVNAVAYAALSDALGQVFAAYGPQSRGQIILNLVNILTTLESNATYGVAAASFNTATLNAYTYASNAANTVASTTSPYAIITTFTLTTGVDTIVGSSGDDTIIGMLDDNFSVPNSTLTNLDSIDGGAGNDTLVVNDVNGDGVPDGLQVRNVETLVLRSAYDAYVDTTTWQGLNTIKVTQAMDVDVYAGATTNVDVSGASDDIYVEGGANVTVVTSAADGRVDVDGAAGAVSVTHTNLGSSWIQVDGGTDVTVVATNAQQEWWWWGGPSGADIDVGTGGDAGDMPTGAISVTVTGAATEANSDLYLGNINIEGGTTVAVKQTATSSSAAAATTGNIVYQGDVNIEGGVSTTEVSVVQSAAVAAVTPVVATAGVKQVDTVTFVGLAAAESVTIGGLTFTAAKVLTAAEVAAAFANLSAAATQGSAAASNGIYTGSFGTYTTGAVTTTGAVITVDATASTAAAGNTPIALSDTAAVGDVAAANKTAGVTAVVAKAGVMGIESGNVWIVDQGTEADTIAAVTLEGYGSASVSSDALTTLNLAKSNASVSVNNASTSATLAMTLNGVGTSTAHGAVDIGAAYTTLNVGTFGANSVVDLAAASVTTLNVGGDKALNLAGASLAALKTVTVTGSAGLTMDADEADTITSFDASGTSGDVTAFIDASISTYAGGSGVDRLTLTSATVSKAVSMGAGDDVLLLASGSTLTANLSGGDGSDAIFMAAADAEAASATETFETKIDGFEKLSLGVVGAGLTETVNLANMDDISFVVVNGITDAAGVLVLDKMASGGTLVFQNNASLGTVDVNLTDATGTADSLNVIVKADGSLAAGTVDAAGVEAINLTLSDSLTPFTAVHSLTLADAALKTVTITGNAGLNLVQNSLVLTSVDGSAMTGALTAATNGTVAQTITGGSAADALTANGNGDVLLGGGGADTLIAKGDLVVLTGGAGNDVFNVMDTTTNLNSYATITDLTAGDKILFGDVTTFAASKVSLGDTAVFQDYANAVINATDTGNVSWFQFSGNTYVIANMSNGAAFANATDVIVKVVGLVDLSTASFSSSADTLLMV